MRPDCNLDQIGMSALAKSKKILNSVTRYNKNEF